jgi:CHASE1-domain containing sensor protein
MNMDIQDKLTAFVVVQSTWIVGLLIGLSMGGIAMALERAFYFASHSELARRLLTRVRRFIRGRMLARAANILGSRTGRPPTRRFRQATRTRVS